MRTRTVLNMQQLETREVPTTATLSNGILRITGTAAADTIRLTQNTTQITVEGMRSYNTGQVQVISVDAFAGDDRVDLRGVTLGSLRTEVYGRDGNDWIWGSAKSDLLDGGVGNDRLYGYGGPDTLMGGDGNDRLFGGGGLDKLYGLAGIDFLDDGNRAVQETNVGGDSWDWDADVVAVNGTTASDIRQGQAPTCSFLATLAGMAQRNHDFRADIRYVGFDSNAAFVYEVSFWDGTA